jgi:hypothetical protein
MTRVCGYKWLVRRRKTIACEAIGNGSERIEKRRLLAVF